MTSTKKRLLTFSVAASCMAIQVGLVTLSQSANADVKVNTIRFEVEPQKTQSLSWIEAQQQRYVDKKAINNAELNSTQENKLVTMMRLMTLEL